MIKYAVLEIGGKQFKVTPKVPFEVDLQDDGEILAKVLMVVNDKLVLGKPYLDQNLKIRRLEDTKGKKIRVAKFHAKANYRRVIGSRRKITRVIMDV